MSDKDGGTKNHVGSFRTTGLFYPDIFNEFSLKLRMQGYSEATITGTCYNVRKFLKTMGVSPRQAGPENVLEYIAFLYDSERYSKRSILTKIQSLKRFYGYLHRSGRILCDPTADLESPELNQNIPKDILSPDEMEAIRKAAKGKTVLKLRDKAIVEVLYSTGLRLSELAALDIADIDLAAGILSVQKGKGGRDRRAVLNPASIEAIKTYLHCRTDRTDALWINCNRARLSAQMIRKVLNHLAESAGVKTPAYPHAWRHGLATALLRRGASIVEVQRFLGHVSIRSTQIYTHILIRELIEMHRKCHPRERDPLNIAPGFQS
jgi:site-specific recombinase XerD